MLEKDFQKKVKKYIDGLNKGWFFTKEALAIRGIPDIIGLVNGRFVALELKRSIKEANKNTGRIVLQKFIIKKVINCGGYATLVYPENWEDIQEELRNLT